MRFLLEQSQVNIGLINMVTITYIWHDCFVISLNAMTLVFDYWRDPLSREGELPSFLKNTDKDRPLYVFVSHHHKDHYNKEIFDWAKYFNHIHFIISGDTARHARHILRQDSLYKGYRPSANQVTVIKPGEIFEIGEISVKAFASTDIGNSYLVNAEGLRIFHAGDLNAWLWVDESTKAEIAQAIGNFKKILDDISASSPQLDIAMFPVDSRIGREYFTGARMFLESIEVGRFFPMHFGLGDESEQRRYERDAMKFDLYANHNRGEYIGLSGTYSTYAFVKK